MEIELSVIMGVFNCEKTLLQTLESLKNQTYKDFVCYVCDDGSKDKTLEIATNFAADDNRFIIIQNDKNRGLSYTLNKCIELCKTPYIARMDGDDIADSQRFEKQIDFLKNHPEIDICGASLKYFDDTGSWGKLNYPENPTKYDFLKTNPFAHPTIIYTKSSIEKMKSDYGYVYTQDKKIGRSEDYDLFMRMYAAGYKGYNFPDLLLNYREDRFAYAKRKFKYTFTDARVRYLGFKKLGLLPKGAIYIAKPIFVGLIPKKIRLAIHQKKFKSDSLD